VSAQVDVGRRSAHGYTVTLTPDDMTIATLSDGMLIRRLFVSSCGTGATVLVTNLTHPSCGLQVATLCRILGTFTT
jgi:hypothetical protein